MKKCPVCNCDNADADFFCRDCGAELSLADGAAKAPPIAKPETAPAGRRVCPQCGEANDPVLPLCSRCGFDLSKDAGKLFLVIGADRFECNDSDVLGRDGTVARSFFSSVGTVSRRHVRLSRRDGRWFVAVLPGVQNITELDGRALVAGVEQALTGEHVLKLSTPCEVRLSVE